MFRGRREERRGGGGADHYRMRREAGIDRR